MTQRSTRHHDSYRILANFKRLSLENRYIQHAAYILEQVMHTKRRTTMALLLNMLVKHATKDLGLLADFNKKKTEITFRQVLTIAGVQPLIGSAMTNGTMVMHLQHGVLTL